MAEDASPSGQSTMESPSPHPAGGGSSGASHVLPELMHTLNAREDLLHLFFHLLWLKQGNGQQHVLTGINIPDTVMVNHSRPIHWYFTSKDGTIKMKTKKNLASKAIVEHMTAKKRLSVSGAAYCLTGRVSRGVDEVVAVSAGSADQLRSSLAAGGTTGLLQNFIDPKSENRTSVHNFVIMANWTPNVLYLEKRYNTLDIRADGPAKQSPLDERVALSEASRFVRVAPLVSSHTTAAMERLCSTVAHHIEVLHGVNVTNLVLHVKLDEANQPWVLYCSSLRVMHLSPTCEPISASLDVISTKGASNQQRSRSAHAAPVRRQSLQGTSTEADSSTRGSSKGAPAPRRGVARSAGLRNGQPRSGGAPSRAVPQPCSLCRDVVDGEAMSLVARQHVLFPLSVVEFFNAHAPGTLFTDQPSGPGAVPPAYALLQPGVEWGEFLSLKDNAAWQDERVPLCESCAAGLESVTANLHVDEDGAIRVPGGTDPLAPTRSAKQSPAPILHSEQRAAMRKAAAADRSPPPPHSRSQSSQSRGTAGGNTSLPPLAPRRTPTPSSSVQYR